MFENRLTKLRNEKGLNMKQTAEKLKMPYTTYVGYEKNEREPNSEVLLLLSNFFGCSTDYLLGRSKVKNPAMPTQDELKLTQREKQLVIAYRSHPDAQAYVDKMLDLPEAAQEQEVKKLA